MRNIQTIHSRKATSTAHAEEPLERQISGKIPLTILQIVVSLILWDQHKALHASHNTITDYNTSAAPRRGSAEVLRKFCNLFVTLYSSTLLHFYAFKKRKYFYAEVKGSEPKSKLLVMSYHETFIYVCKSWRHTDRVTMYMSQWGRLLARSPTALDRRVHEQA